MSDENILVWHDVTFRVKKDNKEILHQASGCLKRGTLMGIIGPSGAGKTTFLDCISGRKPLSDGELYLNSKRVENSSDISYRRRISVVAQQDSLVATDTVEEALIFSAKMRRADCLGNPVQAKKVATKYIEDLGLGECKDVLIGGGLVKGVSGGQRKRTAVGVELLTHPEILFLDEPTSGLDSYSCVSIMKSLKRMCNERGCSIIATIHQPNSEIFDLFDAITVISKGSVMYSGPAKEMLSYLEDISGHQSPSHFNPADFAIREVSELDEQKSNKWAVHYDKHSVARELHTDLKLRSSRIQTEEGKDIKVKRTSWITQFKELSIRNIRAQYRNVPALIARFGILIFINIIIGLVFQNVAKLPPAPGLGASSEQELVYVQSLRALFGALVLILINAMFGTAQPVTLAFPLEKPIFEREYSAGTYSSTAYFLSKFPIDILFSLIASNIAWLIVYWLYGMTANFEVLALITMLLGLSSAAVARLLGSIANDTEVAIQLMPLIFVPQFLFAGVFVPVSAVPTWLQWAQWLCTLKYASGLLMIVVWENPDQYQRDQLAALDINPDLWWVYLIILFGLWATFDLLAAIILTFKARQTKTLSFLQFFFPRKTLSRTEKVEVGSVSPEAIAEEP